jgi:hypothetical protein
MVINKDWFGRWEKQNQYNTTWGEIKNKDILYDINKFLNDRNENSIDNKNLKKIIWYYK